jgi:hypothetical protein
VLLVGIFVLSRIALVARGFSFDLEWVGLSIQNIDQRLLQHHLLQSLWYLHGQPPLWNALLGLSFKLGGTIWPAVWHLAFIGLGLVETLALYALLLEVRIPRWPAAVVTAVFIVAPETLVYENVLTYDYPTLVLLTLTALAIVRYAQRPTFARGFLVFTGVGALILLRTIFQWPWLFLVLALLVIARRESARLAVAGSVLAIALVGGLIAKNWIMYDVPSTTSWSGIMFARSAVVGLPLSERRRLVAEGKLHRVSLVTPLSQLSDYEAVGIKPDPPSGIPLLDDRGDAFFPRNLENRTFIRISRLYWKDDLWIVEHRKAAYARAVGRGAADFFAPATIAWEGTGNTGKIDAYRRWFDRVVFGRVGPGKDGIFLIAVYGFALAAGLWITLRRLRPGAEARTVLVAFSTLAILYLVVVGNLAEVGENYRFRLVVQPLALVLAAAGVRELVDSARRRRSRAA